MNTPTNDLEIQEFTNLDIVIPCYNESESIPNLLQAINAEMVSLGLVAKVIIVDDASTDGTWDALSQMDVVSLSALKIKGLLFSSNSGQMAALEAGFEDSTAPFVISMDADHQHPPALIRELWNARHKAEVVSMQQIRRQDRWIKALFSRSFYFALHKISGLDVKKDVGDFRIYSRAALEAILNYKEHNKVFRFTITELSISHLCLEYLPAPRLYGTTKYNLRKMIRLALDSILGSSKRLLKLSMLLSLFNMLFALIVIAYILDVYFRGGAIVGWISILGTLTVISTGIFSVLGILSLYVQRILYVVTEKPRYRVAKVSELRR